MSSESTEAVLEHHHKTLLAGNLDEVMEDYTDESVFISNLGGVVKGIDAIRSMLGAAGDLPGFEEVTKHVEGEAACTTWKADGIALGADTFIVREGKIILQTVALVFA